MAKTVFITGASTGIGLATAEFFQSKGWNVAATMRSPEKAKKLDGLENVATIKLDVTNEASIANAVEAAVERFGTIDVLVNNAGYGANGVLEATSVEDMRKQFETNVIGLLATTRAVIPVFRKQRSGVIVNISSIGGRITFPFGTLYHGTKFAVEGMTEALRYEMRSIGVQMKIVEPGAIKTEFMNALQFSNDESLTEYQPLVKKTMEIFGPLMAQGAEASVVAEVIYRAATDGSETLRYPAGEDAEVLMPARSAQTDEQFLKEMDSRFGQ